MRRPGKTFAAARPIALPLLALMNARLPAPSNVLAIAIKPAAIMTLIIALNGQRQPLAPATKFAKMAHAAEPLR